MIAPGQICRDRTRKTFKVCTRRPTIDRVGELLSVASSHEYAIRTVDGRELRWENARFVRIPRGEADEREIFLLGHEGGLRE